MMAMDHTKDCAWRTKYNVDHHGKDKQFPDLKECICDCHGVSS